MSNPNKVVGQATITVDGERWPTDGQSTLDIGGVTRNSVIGDYDAGSFNETPRPSQLNCSLLVKQGRSLAQIRAIDNATVSFKTDTGQTYVIRNAYVSEAATLTSNDGKAAVVMMGPPAEELL
ncbi:tail tube protein [Blastomonas natatoria]|uniref:Tail tube protein n=1 Tax=Blastomonas natatoria TaxID=34015 RepID=A0A2V3VBN3_9SPHN|nr:phage tail tube protein [Blastomonas natatoria]PXW78990.1 tail tube protein [Blastomonas natatoria]